MFAYIYVCVLNAYSAQGSRTGVTGCRGPRGVLGTKPLTSAAENTPLHQTIELAVGCTSLTF